MQDVPYGYCECGCGEKTDLIPYNAASIKWVKGEPKRFIHGHQSRKPVQEYRVDAETGCWIWLRHVNRKGYGEMRPHGSKTMARAHRYYYEQAKGPIPEGLTLDHVCHTEDKSCPGGPTCQHRRCVNPDHLEPVTRLENTKRGRPGGYKPGSYKKPKPTHCKHGHEFVPENTFVRKDGSWTCRTCHRAAMLRSYYKRKAREAQRKSRDSPAI